jgi:hypothetical protein
VAANLLVMDLRPSSKARTIGPLKMMGASDMTDRPDKRLFVYACLILAAGILIGGYAALAFLTNDKGEAFGNPKDFQTFGAAIVAFIGVTIGAIVGYQKLRSDESAAELKAVCEGVVVSARTESIARRLFGCAEIVLTTSAEEGVLGHIWSNALKMQAEDMVATANDALKEMWSALPRSHIDGIEHLTRRLANLQSLAREIANLCSKMDELGNGNGLADLYAIDAICLRCYSLMAYISYPFRRTERPAARPYNVAEYEKATARNRKPGDIIPWA